MVTLCLVLDISGHVQANRPAILDAIDCRKPHSVQYGEIETLCPEKSKPKQAYRDYHLLQRIDHKVVKAKVCSRVKTEQVFICGAYSHIKYLQPPTFEELHPMTVEDCQKMITTQQYVSEDGKSHSITVDEEIDLSYVSHGLIKPKGEDNSYCEGVALSIGQELHKDVLVIVAEKIKIEEVDIQYHLDSAKIIDLDNHIELSSQCHGSYNCISNGKTYVVTPPKDKCDLAVIKAATFQERRVLTSNGFESLLLNTDDKIALVKKGLKPSPSQCPLIGSLYATNIESLFVAQVKNAQNMDTVEGHHVNMNIVIQTTEEYLESKLDDDIRKSLRHVMKKTCDQLVSNFEAIERSPFHQHSVIKVLGDVFMHITCRPVQVMVDFEDVQENCYLDYLPVLTMDNEKVLISSRLHLVKELDFSDHILYTSCNSMNTPKFISVDRHVYHMTPKIQRANLTMTKFNDDMNRYMVTDDIVLEDMGKAKIYTDDEMKQFMDLIHEGRFKSQVTTRLIHEFCADNKCSGSFADPGFVTRLQNARTEAMGALEYLENHFVRYVTLIGNVCSILVVSLYVAAIMKRLALSLKWCCCQKNKNRQQLINILLPSRKNKVMDHEIPEQGANKVLSPEEIEAYCDRYIEKLYAAESE